MRARSSPFDFTRNQPQAIDIATLLGWTLRRAIYLIPGDRGGFMLCESGRVLQGNAASPGALLCASSRIENRPPYSNSRLCVRWGRSLAGRAG